MPTEVEPVKKPTSLADTVAKASSIFTEMDKLEQVDPLDIGVPRAGELKPLDNEAPPVVDKEPGKENGEQPASPVQGAVTDGGAVAQDTAAPDPWADFDEIVYGDADTGEEFKVRAPKAYAQKVKDGYARRSVMDRNSRYLSQAKAFLEPLVTSGQWHQLQPFLERATKDPEFATFLGEAYQRRELGQPLSFADAVANATPQQQAQVNQAIASGTPSEEIDDPYIAMIVENMEKRVGKMLQPFQQQLQSVEQQRQQATRAAQTKAHEEAQAQRTINESLQEFDAIAPGAVTRDNWFNLFKYAQSAGYIGVNNDYSPNTVRLGVRLAFRELGGAVTPSPLAAVQQSQKRTPQVVEAEAQAEAARMVAASSNGGGNIAPAQPAPPKKIPTKTKDGKPRKALDVAADVIRQMERAS
jgi:hypothetical protein